MSLPHRRATHLAEWQRRDERSRRHQSRRRAGCRAQKSQAEDRAPMRVDAAGGSPASPLRHAARSLAGAFISRSLATGPRQLGEKRLQRMDAGPQHRGIHVAMTAVVDMTDQPRLWPRRRVRAASARDAARRNHIHHNVDRRAGVWKAGTYWRWDARGSLHALTARQSTRCCAARTPSIVLTRISAAPSAPQRILQLAPVHGAAVGKNQPRHRCASAAALFNCSNASEESGDVAARAVSARSRRDRMPATDRRDRCDAPRAGCRMPRARRRVERRTRPAPQWSTARQVSALAAATVRKLGGRRASQPRPAAEQRARCAACRPPAASGTPIGTTAGGCRLASGVERSPASRDPTHAASERHVGQRMRRSQHRRPSIAARHAAAHGAATGLGCSSAVRSPQACWQPHAPRDSQSAAACIRPLRSSPISIATVSRSRWSAATRPRAARQRVVRRVPLLGDRTGGEQRIKAGREDRRRLRHLL